VNERYRFGEFELQVLRVEIAEMEARFGCNAKWLIRIAAQTNGTAGYEEMIVNFGREGCAIVNMLTIVHSCRNAAGIREMFHRNFRKYLAGTPL